MTIRSSIPLGARLTMRLRSGWAASVDAFFVGLLVVVLVGISSALPAQAQEAAQTQETAGSNATPSQRSEGFRQWILYAAPEIGIYAHTGKGNSSSTQITGPRIGDDDLGNGDLSRTISQSERSREVVASFLAGGTVGFLTPALDLSGHPRAFVDLNVSIPMTTETELARRANPGLLAFPRGVHPPSPVGEGAMVGIGTQLSVQQQGPQVHAGIGVSFELPFSSGQLIRFKPSVVYSRTILDIKGQVVRAVRLNNHAGTNQQLDDFRVIGLKDERTEVYHSAGPAFELEYVPGLQWGPFAFSLFAKGHAGFVLNSRKTKMQQCNTEGGQPNECMNWKYTQDPVAYRATFGFHVNWTPRAFR